MLQRIADTLEAAGIGVSGIETWPLEEDGRVSVSMTIRPSPGAGLVPQDKTEATLGAINAGKSPDDPPAVRDPCGECATFDCFFHQTKNGTPITLSSPHHAAAAMLAGRVLKDERGYFHFWKDRGKDGEGFWFRDDKDSLYSVRDFSGLYEEAKYV
jgi:hypothetical protein